MFTVTEATAVNNLWCWLTNKPRIVGGLVGDFEAEAAMETLALSASNKLGAGLAPADVTKHWREILAARSNPTPRKRRGPKQLTVAAKRELAAENKALKAKKDK